jgi:hypothetical protein
MNQRLQTAQHALEKLKHSTLMPYPLSVARETALIEGLHGLALEFRREVNLTHIHSNGEFKFNLVEGQTYGVELAAWLNTIETRTGSLATKGFVLPEGNWCWINHFQAEQLLLSLSSGAHRPVYVQAYNTTLAAPQSLGCPTLTFDPAWMQDKLPIYVQAPGEPMKLAFREMLSCCDDMSKELYARLLRLCGELDQAVGNWLGPHPTPAQYADHEALHILLNAAPWSLQDGQIQARSPSAYTYEQPSDPSL